MCGPGLAYALQTPFTPAERGYLLRERAGARLILVRIDSDATRAQTYSWPWSPLWINVEGLGSANTFPTCVIGVVSWQKPTDLVQWNPFIGRRASRASVGASQVLRLVSGPGAQVFPKRPYVRSCHPGPEAFAAARGHHRLLAHEEPLGT